MPGFIETRKLQGLDIKNKLQTTKKMKQKSLWLHFSMKKGGSYNTYR